MKNLSKILGLTLLLVGGAAFAVTNYNGITSANLQSQSYLLQRLDDSTLKGYLQSDAANNQWIIGKYNAASSDSLSGVTGTGVLVDLVSGSQVTLPANSLVDRVLVLSSIGTPLSGLTGTSVAVGYIGSTGALVTARAVSSLTANVVVEGVATGTAATAIAVTSATPVSTTLTGASVSGGTGIGYVLIHSITGPMP